MEHLHAQYICQMAYIRARAGHFSGAPLESYFHHLAALMRQHGVSVIYTRERSCPTKDDGPAMGAVAREGWKRTA